MSTKVHNRREGDRSEYFAQVLLSGLGLSTPVPRQEDIGVDFMCSLADQSSGVVTFGHPYLVSVKSKSEPDIELTPTKAAIAEDSQRHLEWLFRQELPLFLGVVDKAAYRLALYSLIPIWFIYYRGGPGCGSIAIRPRVDSTDPSDVGEPKRMQEIPGWPGKYHYEVDVGHPIAVLDLDTLKDTDATKAVRKNIRRAARHARTTQAQFHLGVPYFEWLAKTQPNGSTFTPGFSQYPMPDDPELRKRVMINIAPGLVAFALHYKTIGDANALQAIKVLMKEMPKEVVADSIKAALPEVFAD